VDGFCEHRPEEEVVNTVAELCYDKHSMLAQTPTGFVEDNGLDRTVVCPRQTPPPAGCGIEKP